MRKIDEIRMNDWKLEVYIDDAGGVILKDFHLDNGYWLAVNSIGLSRRLWNEVHAKILADDPVAFADLPDVS